MAGKRYQPTANYPTEFPGGEAITFDVDAFDEAIRSQGVLFEHFAAMRCPVGMVDRDDTVRRPHEHHEGCSNGFIYTKVGSFQALLTGNGKQVDFKDQGLGDSSTASATFPRFYAADECNPSGGAKRVYVMPFDRIYYSDERVLVPNWEIVTAHPSGNDRLMFPAVELLGQIVDSNGVRYSCGVDFSIINGGVHWLGPNRPGQNTDPEIGTGVTYALRYLYRPYWYIRQMVHEIRVTQVEDVDGRRVEKMPQAAVVQREYVFLNQEHDEALPSDGRSYRGPSDGSLPSR